MVTSDERVNQSIAPDGGGGSGALTPMEAILLAAFRSGDTEMLGNVFLETCAEKAADPGLAQRIGEQVLKDFGPLSEPDAPLSPYLNSSQRLALHIIAQLGLKAHFPQSLLDEDGGHGLFWLYHDIADAIRTGLPLVDHEEMRRMMEGKPAE